MEYLGVQKTKFILPTAPERPISLNHGMPMPGWSDIYGLHSDDREDLEGFSDSVRRIDTLVQREINENNIPHQELSLVDFPKEVP